MKQIQAGDREVATAAAVNALRRIMRHLRVAAEATRAEAGLSAAQLFVLRQLSGGESRSIAELARLTLTDRTSVASVLERLLLQGLVERTRSQSDRRRVEIRITALGEQRLATAPPAPTGLLIAALSRLPAQSVRELGGSLEQLVRELGVADAPAGMLFEDTPARRGVRQSRAPGQ